MTKAAAIEPGGKRYRWKTVGYDRGALMQEIQEVDEAGNDLVATAPPACTCCPVHGSAPPTRDAEPWLDEEDDYLREAAKMGRTLRQMAHHLARMPAGVRERLVALGIEA